MNQNEFNEINEEETNNEDDWEELKADKDYLICKTYPHQIKRKKTNRIIKEWSVKGYIQCKLNGVKYYKHRLIANQWIPNPDNLPEIDHINHNRCDNRIENLRFVSHLVNLKNISSMNNIKFTFLDVLPETTERLDSYNGHDLDGVFVDYDNEKLYIFNGIRYRELLPRRQHGNIVYWCHDIENKNIALVHKILFR